eukprot:3223904-Rhodomonas_salina.7
MLTDRICYVSALSGTDLAYVLWIRYAITSTDRAYLPTVPVWPALTERMCYAPSMACPALV